MKKLLGTLLIVLLLTGTGWAFSFPAGPIEMDMDNYTRLYNDDGTVVDSGTPPAVGYNSWTFLNFNQLGPTIGLGGPDLPATWTGGTNGEYLYAVERGIEIGYVDPNNPNEFYFQRDANFTGYEFELFVSSVDLNTFYSDSNYLGMGVNNPQAIYDNLVANSTRILAGNYALSTYLLEDGSTTINALAGVASGTGFLGGQYLNQVTTPYGLGVNAFLDVDPTIGLGYLLDAGAYGTGPDGSEYDIAIQNVNLFSELNPNGWIVSDDGTRMNIVPEPTTFVLFGLGLLGFSGIGRRFRKN